jgi:hypothetical protein
VGDVSRPEAGYHQAIFQAGMRHAGFDIDPAAARRDGCAQARPWTAQAPKTRRMIFQRSTLDRIEVEEVPPRMAGQHEQGERLTVTASLTTGVGRVTHGMREAVSLIEEILTTDHVDWETTLSVGDVEFHSTKQGPYPNHQLRISVRPSAGVAALKLHGP